MFETRRVGEIGWTLSKGVGGESFNQEWISRVHVLSWEGSNVSSYYAVVLLLDIYL